MLVVSISCDCSLIWSVQQDFLADTIQHTVLKEEEVDREKTGRRTFRRHKTENTDAERPLEQAAALLAARYRIGTLKRRIPVRVLKHSAL